MPLKPDIFSVRLFLARLNLGDEADSFPKIRPLGKSIDVLNSGMSGYLAATTMMAPVATILVRHHHHASSFTSSFASSPCIIIMHHHHHHHASSSSPLVHVHDANSWPKDALASTLQSITVCWDFGGENHFKFQIGANFLIPFASPNGLHQR